MHDVGRIPPAMHRPGHALHRHEGRHPKLHGIPGRVLREQFSAAPNRIRKRLPGGHGLTFRIRHPVRDGGHRLGRRGSQLKTT